MQTVKQHMKAPATLLGIKIGVRVAVLWRAGSGVSLVSGFANLCVFMQPVPIWQNSGGNWLKCRNGSFVILGFILLLRKLRPKNHHGTPNHPRKRHEGKARRNNGRSRTNWSGDHSRGVKIMFCRRRTAESHYAAMMDQKFVGLVQGHPS
jgi:hypothetical protein